MKYIFLFIFLFSTRIEPQEFNYYIIWNVGQGLWQSYITPSKCYHYDMGGEKAPWSLIKSLCRKKLNIIRISHWDLDHYVFFKDFQRQFRNICFSFLSLPDKKIKFKWLLKKQKICELKKHEKYIWRPKNELTHSKNKKHGSNVYSEIIVLNDILMTGDSPKEIEIRWIKEVNLKGIQKLIVGHHGSNTSSSQELLSRLNSLNLFFVGIVSARKKRYGHPHWAVKKRFKKFKTPLLTTEKWGHIIYRY